MTRAKDDFYIETVNDYRFKMIKVEEGSFDLGDEYGDLWNACRPVVKDVNVKTFHIAEFPVTNALWKAVMGDCHPHTSFKEDQRPVDNVSWEDICQKDGFLDRLNRIPEIAEANRLDGKRYRLPKEVQWEYATRGGIDRTNHRYKYAGSRLV